MDRKDGPDGFGGSSSVDCSTCAQDVVSRAADDGRRWWAEGGGIDCAGRELCAAGIRFNERPSCQM